MIRPTRYTQFLGLDTSNDPVKHRNNAGIKLTKAENVNLSRVFSVERRDGYSLWKSGSYSNLWGNGEVCYATKAGDLYKINADSTETLLQSSVGNFPMSFADTRTGYVYWTNGAFIGKIKDGVASDLGSTTDEFKATLPAGKYLAYLAPRLLVAKSNVIFISDPIKRDVYHQYQGFIQFDSEVQMMAPIGKSLFVSDEKNTWFLRKMDNPLNIPAPLFRMEKVADYPSVSGNPFKEITDIAMGEQTLSEAVMWVSKRGVCIGGPDGLFVNLTEQKYEMPSVMESACVEFRQAGDLNLFISVIKGV